MSNSEPWTTLHMSFEKLMYNLNDAINEVYVVLIKEEVIGVIIIQTQGAFSGYLKSIALKKEWQGKGFGEIMMNFFEQKAFKTSENAFLCVSSFNTKAQKFYLKRGYTIVGVLKDYIIKGKDEILMRKRRN